MPYAKKQKKDDSRGRGFTAVEIVIVLILLGIILTIAFASVGGENLNRNRASGLYNHMKLVALAYRSQDQLLGCGANNVPGLFQESDFLGASNNTCGATSSSSLNEPFSGPYLKGIELNAENPAEIILDGIVSGTTGAITTAIVASITLNVYNVSPLNDNLRTAIMRRCKGDDTLTDTTIQTIAPESESEPCGANVTDSIQYYLGPR